MFADSLLDSNWDNRSHRGWTTLASFAMQALAVGNPAHAAADLQRRAPKAARDHHRCAGGAASGKACGGNATCVCIRAPEYALDGDHHTTVDSNDNRSQSADPIPVPDVDACPTCVPGGTGDLAGDKNSVVGAFDMSTGVQPPIPAFKPTVPQRRVSTIMEGNLVYKPQPAYPPSARSMRIQGPVVLRAIISKSGAIENLQVLSGHPLLVKAAIEAVSQWRYRPYVLNGEPVEVETRVIVNFTLSGG